VLIAHQEESKMGLLSKHESTVWTRARAQEKMKKNKEVSDN
jgi:hypothetical protein